MLKVRQLDFDYYDRPLLRAIDFNLPTGGLLHLKGKNGSGKTTLIKLIAGLYQPHHGEILFLDKPIEQGKAAYHKQLFLLGHRPGINPFLTLKENCLFNFHYNESENCVNELAAVFQLEEYLNTPCGLLSAGQKRQVALLGLWMSQASLWLLDEPFTALDDNACDVLMLGIQKHRQKGGAVLLSAHQKLPLDSLEYQEYLL